MADNRFIRTAGEGAPTTADAKLAEVCVDDYEPLRSGLKRAFETANEPKHKRELCWTSLAAHTATGVTTHRRDGAILPKPASLAIAQFGDEPGYYLLYLDEAGEEMTNTYRESLERAFAQANAKFRVANAEWSQRGA